MRLQKLIKEYKITLIKRYTTEFTFNDFIETLDRFSAKPTPYEFEKGKIPRSALEQGVFWRDRTGKLYEISEMNAIHARNALKKVWLVFKYSAVDTPLYRALAKQSMKLKTNY